VTPIARLTVAFAAGILAGAYGVAPPGGPVLLGVSAIAAAATLLCVRARAGEAWLAAFAFALAGAVAGRSAGARADGDCAARLPADAAVAVAGVAESAPVDGATLPFRAVRVALGEVVLDCRTTLRLRLRSNHVLPAGEGVIVYGRWRAMTAARTWPVRSSRRGVLVADSVRSADSAGARSIAARGSAGDAFVRLRGAAQARVRLLYPRDWPLAEALILARREGLPDRTRERFVAAGLAHLLAISGTHVALVAGALLLAARLARLPVAASCALAAAVTVAYVLFLGAPHAAARAALQLLVFLGTRLAQRPVEPLSAVALAALVLLVLDPLALLDPGFQLSFAGVVGIVRLRRPLIDALPRALPRALRDALATGVAASLPTTPIAGLHFQHISIIGVLSGVVALPVLAIAVPALALTLLIAPVAPGAAAFLAGGTALLLAALDRIAALAAAVPGGHGSVTPPAVLGALAGALLFIVLQRMRSRPPLRAARASILRPALIATSIALLAPPLALRMAARGIEIHALDVGQGDAFAVRTPAGRWILIDAGPASPGYDTGARVVVPFLRRHGVRRLDALVLTHPHADHIGGARAVLEAFDVALVIDPGASSAHAMYLSTIEAARRRGTTWIAARAGLRVRVDGVDLDFLHPDESVLDAVTDPNDYSAVFRMGYGRFGALFLGDAPVAVENALVREFAAALEAQVVKVGHHGSRTATGDSLLAHVAPALALVSAGRRNRFGHPTPEVMRRLAAHGVRTLRTDSAGTLRVRARADGRLLMEPAR
jgi:competence protein ComEC